VDDVRPASQKCLRHELSLDPEPVAGSATKPERPNVNRQSATVQYDLAREIRIERDEGDVVTTRYQGSDLVKWRGTAGPCGNFGGLVEQVGQLQKTYLTGDGDSHRDRRPAIIRT
jgi:hypothetical protein